MNAQPLPAANATLWSRLKTTGLGDLLRGRLTGNLDMRGLIAAAALSEPLDDLTRQVACRTRLWRIEQVEVARELAEHFRDGLAAGRTPEQLIESFGDPRQAARLIRRAKLRSRPLFWRLWRRGVQALGAIAALTIALGLYFVIRFFTAHPTLAHNYRLELVAPTQGVPEADRAWPFYREAMLQLTPVPEIVDTSVRQPNVGAKDSGDKPSGDVAESEPEMVNVSPEWERPGGKHWDKVEQWLDENQAVLEQVRHGAARPRFGFVYNDPADRAWFDSVHTDPASIDPARNEGAITFPLPQLQAVGRLEWLLVADARRALATGDENLFLSDVQALAEMSEQINADLKFVVFNEISFAYFQDALALIDESLVERPELLDHDSLRALAHRIAAYTAGVWPDGERLMFLDMCQRAYSDNGRGDGVLTREGLEVFAQLQGLNNVREARLEEPAFGAAVAALAPSRRTMTELVAEYSDRIEREFHRPLWQWTDASLVRELRERQDSEIDRIRYAPLSMLIGQVGLPGAYYAGEIVTQQRDATLVALALNLYHRQHDAWPEHLDELVPDLLPAVPPDRFTGGPLCYRVLEGRPLLYSAGPDRVDDGGESVRYPAAIPWLGRSGTETYPAGSMPAGDWILWPPQP